MQVTLLTSENSITDMERFAAKAALTCKGNYDNDVVPNELLTRIIKLGHESILEHIYLTYRVQNLSRACLQELARHRHITLSVESTRHTLRENITKTFLDMVNNLSGEMLDMYFKLKAMAEDYPDMPNDELKYYLPEFWPTNLILTTNVRELRHILNLRSAPAALKEFQLLAHKLFEAVPDNFKYLLQDCVHPCNMDWSENVSGQVRNWNSRSSGIFEREKELYSFAAKVANGYFLDYESVIDEAEMLINKYELED